MTAENILVIKHSALGDIVLATAAFKSIREHHPNAHITLLTTKPYANLLAQSPYFNDIWVDTKPKWHNFAGIKQLRAILNSKRWSWIYDLQTSQRTTLYPWLLRRPWPNISNSSHWTSHGYTDPARHAKHALENLKLQLAITGINTVGMPDVSWMDEEIGTSDWRLGTGKKEAAPNQPPAPSPQPPTFALLIPGGAPHRPDKRWPAEQYASLAVELTRKNITPLLIGTNAEAEVLASIAARVPAAINLCGKTTIPQIATLARKAALAVGNDTGPMHLIAASNCPSTVIFSHASNPAQSAPVGAKVTILRERDLSKLTVNHVLSTLTPRA